MDFILAMESSHHRTCRDFKKASMHREETNNMRKKSISLKSSEDSSTHEMVEDKVSWKFWKRRRYIVVLLAFFGFFSGYILRVNLSMAVIAMTVPSGGKEAEFHWDSKLQGYILSSFFYGYISTMFLSGWLSSQIGGKRVFGIGIGVMSVLTLMTPALVRLNVYCLIILRIFIGIFGGLVFPAMHAIWSNWAPPLERSKLATSALAGNSCGSVFAMSVSGILAEHLGWPSIFYIFGVIALIAASLWLYFITSDPADDPRISDSELSYIKQSLGLTNCVKSKIVHPWKEIFTSPPVLAIVVAHFCKAWGFHTMITQLPKYLNSALNFKLEKAGFFSALPYLLLAIILPSSGHLADYLRTKKIFTTTQVRKLYTCSSFLLQTLFTLLAAFTQNVTTAVACVTIAIAVDGFCSSGFGVNHLDVAPHHASVLLGISNSVATLSGIISPILTGHIVQNGTAEEWRIVFMISSVLFLIGAVVYGCLASGEKQIWAMEMQTKEMPINGNNLTLKDNLHTLNI